MEPSYWRPHTDRHTGKLRVPRKLPMYSSAMLGARTAYCTPPRKVRKLTGAQFSSAFQVEVLPAVLYFGKAITQFEIQGLDRRQILQQRYQQFPIEPL